MSQVQLKNFVLFPGVRSCPSAAFREEFCPSVMPWETTLKLLECQEQQHFQQNDSTWSRGSQCELLLFPGTLQFIISIFCGTILGCRNLSVFSKVSGILSNWAVKLLFWVTTGELC